MAGPPGVALSPTSSSCSPQAGTAACCCRSLRSCSLVVPDSVVASVRCKSASTSESAHSDSLLTVIPNIGPAAGSPVNPRSSPGISWAQVAKGSGDIHFAPLKYFPPPAKDGLKSPMRPPVEVVQQCSEVWGSTFVGRFINKPLHFSAVNAIARKIWARFGLRHVAANDDGLYFFQFGSVSQLESCLAKGPWAFQRNPIFLKRWEPGLNLEQESLKSFPVWISLINIPIEYWTPLGLSWIASRIGKPIICDPSTAKMDRVKVARMCVEVGRGDPLPSKIQILTGAADSATTVEVEIIYHSKPARSSSALLNNQKRATSAAINLPLAQAPPVSGSELLVGLEKGSTECDLDGSGVVNSAPDELGSLQHSNVAIAEHILAHPLMAETLGLDLGTSDVNPEPIVTPSVEACISSRGGTNLAASEGSVLDVFDSINSFAILQDPADLDVQGLQCGPPVELTCIATVSKRASKSKDEMLVDQALDQASFLKRVRFAPEVLSVEALRSAPHRRKLAPCSDICHPVKFRRSNLGILVSEDIPEDDGPNPGANVECHVLSIPPSDGVTPEMEPASVIDPDITPSPISRILKKYVGSPDRAKEKTRSKIKPCKSK